MRKNWKLKGTVVYNQIVDEEDNLICFVAMRDRNLKNAELIVRVMNLVEIVSCEKCLGVGFIDGMTIYDYEKFGERKNRVSCKNCEGTGDILLNLKK